MHEETDTQNDFPSEGGSLHDAVKGVVEQKRMRPNTVQAVEKARELGATIIHAPIPFTPDYYELSPTPYGFLRGVVESQSCRKGFEVIT